VLLVLGDLDHKNDCAEAESDAYEALICPCIILTVVLS
jgi:hypothetical protein